MPAVRFVPLVRFVRIARPLAAAGLIGCAFPSAALAQPAPATTPAELLAGYTAAAGAAASAQRGEKFFKTNFGKEMGWSCASCHTADPARVGRHDATDKAIKPLAPAANAARFTDRRQVEFYFKLNCKDVVGRECTAQEKADVLAWLLSAR
jgi:cytochrome c peroxidase